MKRNEAKEILMAWRPGHASSAESQVVQALDLARTDAELAAWLERHTALQRALQTSFQQAPVPEDLEERVLARAKTVPLPFWRSPSKVVAAAAILLLFLGLSALWVGPEMGEGDGEGASFDTFRSRMVRSVLRQYRMDIESSDMAEVRRFLAGRGAPGDYSLGGPLGELPVLGAGLLSWQDQQVSMVCFDGGERGTLFLFVVDRSAVRHPPPADLEFERVSRLDTVSWSQGDRAYVLAAHKELEGLID